MLIRHRKKDNLELYEELMSYLLDYYLIINIDT